MACSFIGASSRSEMSDFSGMKYYEIETYDLSYIQQVSQHQKRVHAPPNNPIRNRKNSSEALIQFSMELVSSSCVNMNE